MSEKQASGNGDFAWSEFDSEAYFNHYYGEPHPDDDKVIRHACAALQAARPQATPLDCVDVGTGPNLFPLFCAQPRASHVTAWEFSRSNVEWLQAELADDGMRPQWDHFWQVVRDAYGSDAALPANPKADLRSKTTIKAGSIYDLPERRWDAATMFFCAESITSERSEFELACRRFAKCVRPGGSLVAAFLVGSSRYSVADRPFPILNVSAADIRELFDTIAADQTIEQIGLVDHEIRSGYSGMAFLTATAI